MPSSTPRETTRDRLRRVASDHFGWPGLGDDQLAAMEGLLEGRDVLAVMPTGSGKSAIYQLPAMLLDGPAVVVSPLIALQRDQIGQLDDADAPDAVAVNSAQRSGEQNRAWQAARSGEAEYLFFAPEQLAKEETLTELADTHPALFVVDEAHCVSAWGHDFRPDYLRLAQAAERLGRPPVLALTATAGGPVREDIVEHLGLRDPVCIVSGFDRPNLFLAARRPADEEDRRAALVDWVASARTPGIVYAPTRKDTEHYADDLRATGLRVEAFHAGLPARERKRTQDAFMAGETDVVVATSAFGMGIDKPDVRFVVHAAPPESLDSYYQQIGRAGRDGEPADAVLFHRAEDLSLQRFLTARSLDEGKVREVADAVEEHKGEAGAGAIAGEVDQSRRSALQHLNLLEQADAVRYERGGGLSLVAGKDVEQAAARQFERQRELDRTRIEVVREYAETRSCRRQFLLGYFGEDLPRPCGFCDNCEAGTAEEHAPDESVRSEFGVDTRVRHPDWGPGVVVNQEADRLTVLFDDAGYRTLSLPAVREGELLDRE
ncbi:RecQ family ATP-dependent DNA helicase [Prauserella oleivorans]|uniref:ATP-dependent DNA helicase RecQ n=1 Tax=Prauserella oleivorans TaxID=1478153 RepID=A0ABW5W5W8_9PSEU